MPRTRLNTLVFFAGALGDSVLLWPTLRAMAPLQLIGPHNKARLAARWMDQITAMDGETPEWGRLFAPAAHLEVGEDVRAVLRGASSLVSFISNGRDTWAKNVTALAPQITCLFVESRPTPSWAHSILEFHHHQLRCQGLALEPIAPTWRRHPDGPVVVHPGSGGRDKCWPLDRFEALMRHLQAIGRPAIAIMGEVERDRMTHEQLAHWRNTFELIEPEDVIALSEVLVRASVFVGNDSGPAHLAAQLGIPTVAMFGPTDPAVWQPQGPRVIALWPGTSGPVNRIPLEAVIQAVARIA